MNTELLNGPKLTKKRIPRVEYDMVLVRGEWKIVVETRRVVD